MTVVLYDRQTVALDDLSHEIFRQSRTKITRAEIIRAMIDAALHSGIQLAGATTEQQMRDLLATRLGPRKG